MMAMVVNARPIRVNKVKSILPLQFLWSFRNYKAITLDLCVTLLQQQRYLTMIAEGKAVPE